MVKRVTTSAFKKMKKEKQKITMLTAYDYPTARMMDRIGIDAILVGDSLGMVVLGYDDTTMVTMEDMIHHSRAVSRGVERAMVVTDMPFLSYHMGTIESVRNAGRLVQQGGAQAVKMEGGQAIIEDVKAIIKAGIPVMGHLGLTPQSINTIGGYFIQGKTEEKAKEIIEDAKRLEDAGVFALVLECVPAELAEIISLQLTIPTIGIGAGNKCDGQVLVVHDMLQLYHKQSPKFVKSYAGLGAEMEKAFATYIEEVRQGIFPGDEHSFNMDAEQIDELYGGQK